jgi:DhnA family fructose-bisphosphate aldolase class Ia
MAEEIEIIVTATGFDKVSTGLKNTTDALKTTATEAKKTGDALKSNLNTGAAQAGQSITNLSRIAQDAPFGFIGIANNINPLVESFGRLKAETGSTGGALKALVSGLSGPAGLGLAFGVVTAAFTFAQIGLQAWSRTSKEAADASDQYGGSLVRLSNDIKNVGTDLKDLKTELDFIKATKDLEFKINFGGAVASAKSAALNVRILGEETAQANLDVGQSIQLYNQATAALDKFANTQQGSFESTNSFRNAIRSFGDISNVTSDQLAGFTDEQKRYVQVAVDAAKKVNEQKKIYKDYQNQVALAKLQVQALEAEERRKNATNTKSVKKVETLADAYRKFLQEIEGNVKIAIAFNEPATKANIQSYTSFIETAIRKFNANRSFTLPLVIELNDLKKSLETIKPEDLVKTLQDQINLTPIAIPFTIPVGSINNIKKQTVDLTEVLGAAVQSSIVAIGVGLGEALATALTGGDLTSVFQALFSQLGGIISTLGEQVIAIGVAGILAQQAIAQALANPFLAIAAGVALVALGSLIKSSLSSQNKFAVGTRNAPGGMALVGERGPEMISLPRGSQVLPAAQTANMLGGVGGALEIFGILRGQDIYFSNKKYSATYARTT